jgi:GTPase SAR1 family protein
MDLTEITIDNYRGFKKESFELSKITLLLGPNSSGKTSVLSALLSSLQSDQFPSYFSPNGKFVESGDFREIVSSHDTKRQISITLKLNDQRDRGQVVISGTYGMDALTSMPSLLHANYGSGPVTWTLKKSGENYSIRAAFSHDKNIYSKAREKNDGLKVFYSALEDLVTSVKKADPEGKRTDSAQTIRGNIAHRKANLSNIFSSNSGNFDDVIALKHSETCIKDFSRKFCYIGSYRFPPQRTYYHSVGSDLRVGTAGQNTIEQILSWENASNPNIKSLAAAMKKLGLASSIVTHKLTGGRFEVRIRAAGSTVSSSLSDVGFGVNQFLPILVAEIQLGKGSTIAISQPETHLHPKVQAEIASHMAEKVKSEDFKYIVETHSEYLINRLRRLIRKGDLLPGDVNAYYIEPTSSGKKVSRVTFEKTGVISGAPRGFFDTYQMDVMNIALER